MGVGPIALALYSFLFEKEVLRTGQSLIDLGSQDLCMENCKPLVSSMLVSTSRIRDPDEATKVVEGLERSSRALMQALGFRYECIDLDGKWGAWKLNLNESLPVMPTFDVVANHGTTEHCFDQSTCFHNAHNLCKVGGVMIHCVPMVGYPAHCFYNYHPELFVDIAKANDYEMVLMQCSRDDGPWINKVIWATWNDAFSVLNASENILIVVVMRKTHAGKFKVPIQSRYQEPKVQG